MKLFHLLILICAACVLAGCSRQEPTLDEAIDALSDEWGTYSDKLERLAKEVGTTVLNRESSTNNYAMLNRVIAVTNVQERIRLTWKLYNHCRRTPEWYVEHREDRGRNHHRKIFLHNCAHELMMSPNATPETIVEGWKIKAAIVKDMEELMRLTGPEWQARMQKRYEVEEAARHAEFRRRLKAHGGGPASYYHQKHAPELGFADDVKWEYINYFKHSFAANEFYAMLPDTRKPAFLEQLKRDFFIYSDVTNAYMWKYFQPELKEAFREVQEHKMEQKATIGATAMNGTPEGGVEAR